MNQRIFCIVTALALTAACMNETPIGSTSPDPDAGADVQIPVDPTPGPMPDTGTSPPVTHHYAVKNQDGSYSCNTNFTDPCANVAIEHNQECGLPVGTVCDAKTGLETTPCTCQVGNGKNVWSCIGGITTRPDCPTVIPTDGASCTDDLRGIGCEYLKPLSCSCPGDIRDIKPRYVSCSCDFKTSKWKCSTPGWVHTESNPTFSLTQCLTPDPVIPQGPMVDATKAVSAMTDAEVETWCRWSYDLQRERSGLPHPEPMGQVDGYGFGWGGGTFCSGTLNYCLTQVPLNDCKRLLKRKPCGAKVKQLSNCFLTAFTGCTPVEEGCGPMASDPECRETLVQFSPMSSPEVGCLVPLN